MKRFALAIGMGLGLAAIAVPASAATFAWNIEYSGWWEADGGGSIFGTIIADEQDVLDGIVSTDEIKSWVWDWSGNNAVAAFSISSKDAGASTDFSPSFYIDGRLNQPIGADFVDPDGLDQGSFIAGNQVLDFQALLVASYTDGETFSAGDTTLALGGVSVSEPIPVPEPTTALAFLALAGVGAVTLKRKQEA